MGRLGRITWKLPQLDPLRQLECFGKKVMPENSRLVDVDHFGANPGNLHMRKYVPKGLIIRRRSWWFCMGARKQLQVTIGERAGRR